MWQTVRYLISNITLYKMSTIKWEKRSHRCHGGGNEPSHSSYSATVHQCVVVWFNFETCFILLANIRWRRRWSESRCRSLSENAYVSRYRNSEGNCSIERLSWCVWCAREFKCSRMTWGCGNCRLILFNSLSHPLKTSMDSILPLFRSSHHLSPMCAYCHHFQFHRSQNFNVMRSPNCALFTFGVRVERWHHQCVCQFKFP